MQKKALYYLKQHSKIAKEYGVDTNLVGIIRTHKLGKDELISLLLEKGRLTKNKRPRSKKYYSEVISKLSALSELTIDRIIYHDVKKFTD